MTLDPFPLRTSRRRRRSVPGRAALGALMVGGVVLSSPHGATAAVIPAQTAGSGLADPVATVRVEENFRAEPNGIVLASLLPGTTLLVQEREGPWIRAEMEGWVWMQSLRTTDRLGLDLVVTPAEGENLRSGPRDAILGRLEPGTLLEEVERVTGWILVRRAGWIWGESVDVADAVDGGADTGGEEVSPAPPAERTTTAATTAEGESDDRGVTGSPVARAPSGGLPVLAAPDGDTLARAVPGAELQVLAREGGWARVRVEGWSWLPEEAPGADSLPPDATGVSPSRVREDPGAYRGRVVTWPLQFISLERAERVRTEFFEGEPFLLARLPEGEGSFVYVAVPRDRLEEVQGLVPLERITVVARIRVGASSLTGSPVLDLMELRREGRR